MFHQKVQSFSSTTSLKDVQKPLPLFVPYEIKSLTVFILEERVSGSEQSKAGLKDFAWERVYISNGVSEGLRIATEAQFDVAVLDAEVGGVDSSLVAAAVSKRGIPLVLCTHKHFEPVRQFENTLVLRNPSPGEKLRAVVQQADPHRDHQFRRSKPRFLTERSTLPR